MSVFPGFCSLYSFLCCMFSSLKFSLSQLGSSVHVLMLERWDCIILSKWHVIVSSYSVVVQEVMSEWMAKGCRKNCRSFLRTSLHGICMKKVSRIAFHPFGFWLMLLWPNQLNNFLNLVLGSSNFTTFHCLFASINYHALFKLHLIHDFKSFMIKWVCICIFSLIVSN